MGLSGNLQTMSLPDLLQWLSAAGKTGTLTFTRGGITKTIYADEGRIVGSSSNDPTDFLGQWLVAYGRISEDQLRIALGEQERSNTFLGVVLVQMKALSEQDLGRALAHKTEEIIYGLFHWDDANFSYDDGPYAQVPFRISLRIEDVLLKGVRRYDEIQRIREVFPDSTAVVRTTGLRPPASVVENPHASRIFDHVDGARSIAAIALQTHASEYVVSKFLFDLHRSGIVEIVAAPAPKPAPVAAKVPEGELVTVAAGEAPFRPLASSASAQADEAGAADDPGAAAASEQAGQPAEDAVPGSSESGTPSEPSAGSAEGLEPHPHDTAAIVGMGRALMDSGNYERALQVFGRASEGNRTVMNLLLRTEELLVERLYQETLPAEAVPVLARPLHEMTDEKLSPEESFLLSRIDGEWDIRSIVSISPLREIEALRTLRTLKERGLMRLK